MRNTVVASRSSVRPRIRPCTFTQATSVASTDSDSACRHVDTREGGTTQHFKNSSCVKVLPNTHGAVLGVLRARPHARAQGLSSSTGVACRFDLMVLCMSVAVHPSTARCALQKMAKTGELAIGLVVPESESADTLSSPAKMRPTEVRALCLKLDVACLLTECISAPRNFQPRADCSAVYLGAAGWLAALPHR